MRLAWVILIEVILIMNIANAPGEVFYRTVRLDDLDIFYRAPGPKDGPAGRYDTSFTVAGGEAYKKDDPRAEIHILDAGHFALDLKPKEIIRLTKGVHGKAGTEVGVGQRQRKWRGDLLLKFLSTQTT